MIVFDSLNVVLFCFKCFLVVILFLDWLVVVILFCNGVVIFCFFVVGWLVLVLLVKLVNGLFWFFVIADLIFLILFSFFLMIFEFFLWILDEEIFIIIVSKFKGFLFFCCFFDGVEDLFSLFNLWFFNLCMIFLVFEFGFGIWS